MTDLRMLRAAEKYARLGWPVLPLYGVAGGRCTCPMGQRCSSPGKHPRTARGLYDASTDPKQVLEWWGAHLGANIGIVTGRQSGLVVIDVDQKKDGPASAALLLADLGIDPSPFRARTGGGGYHLYYRYSRDESLRNRVELRPGIDVRADGGFVVAPPSSHASGNRYSWDEAVTSLSDLPELPDPLRELLIETDYGKRAPRDLVDSVCSGLGEGGRNNGLARLTGHILRRRAHPEIAHVLMQAYNSKYCKPPLSEEEVSRIVNSIARRELVRRSTRGHHAQ